MHRAVLLFLILATLGAGGEKSTLPPDLLDMACEEVVALKAGRAERKNRDLIVWLPGYADHGTALLFRDAKNSVPSKFTYCGATKNYQLVQESFDHDSPMLYFIESNGRKRRFHVGDDNVYVGPDDRFVLTVSENAVVNVLGVRDEIKGSYRQPWYEEEWRCDLKSVSPIQASHLTANEIGVRSKKGEGVLRLKLDKQWAVVERTGVFKSACRD